MATRPRPPSVETLRALGPALVTARTGTLLWRVYFRGVPHAPPWHALRPFGPTGSGRFDHHVPPGTRRGARPDRAILYAADQGAAALAEVFQEKRTIDRTDREPWLVAFALARDVALLDLTGDWPARAGANTEALCSGPHEASQRWSRVIHEAYPEVEGLRYASSVVAGSLACALYERARSALPARPELHRALTDPLLASTLEEAARDLGYAVV
ncbi:MAG: RES family NAD+ phosphorylase [Anaeromyxobacteraceae bacterium]